MVGTDFQISRLALTADGHIAKRHLRFLEEVLPDLPGVTVYKRPGRPLQITGGRVKREEDMQRVLDAQPDLVVVTSPTATHISYATEALKAGCHVVVEKPISKDLSAVEKLIQLAKHEKKYLYVLLPVPFMPAYRGLEDVIKSQKFGKVVSLKFFRNGMDPVCGKEGRSHYYSPEAGGCLWDLGIHDVHYLTRLFGKLTLKEQQVNTEERNESMVPVNVHLEFELGESAYTIPRAMGVLETSWVNSSFEAGFVVEFERGTICFNGKKLLFKKASSKETTNIQVPDGNGYKLLIEDIINSLQRGSFSKTITLEDVLDAHRFLSEVQVQSGNASIL